jgi:hypothetical protein
MPVITHIANEKIRTHPQGTKRLARILFIIRLSNPLFCAVGTLDQTRRGNTAYPNIPATSQYGRPNPQDPVALGQTERLTVLLLADLGHAKSAALNSLASPGSRRSYEFAIQDFVNGSVARGCITVEGRMFAI